MALSIVRTGEERVVGAAVLGETAASVAERGEATLLVPSFSQALDAQRALAALGGPSLGVAVTTPSAWAEARWGVWGDGSRLVDDVTRRVLCARVLERAAGETGCPLASSPGAAGALARLAREGLAWLAGAAAPEGVTEAERSLVGLLGAYARELRARGLVEGCEVMASLGGLLRESGASPRVVMAGFTWMDRATRALALGVAGAGSLTLVARDGASPALARTRAATEALAREARGEGVGVGESVDPAGGEGPGRAPELAGLLSALFGPGDAPVEPTGAVRLLLPAGPSAAPELVCREVASLAARGARDVAIVAPDPAGAWGALSGRLAARGVSSRARLSTPLGELGLGRSYLEYVSSVARLVGLDASWPAAVDVPGAPRAGTVRVSLGDMSWWPPRELSDFLVSPASHVDPARARRIDAQWRGNRLLTPAAVLAQLQSEREGSPELAAATRELLRGRLGSAASRLLGPLAQGAGPVAAEAAAVLAAVLGVSRSLRALGLTADPSAEGSVGLPELASVALEALGATSCPLRPALDVPGAACRALVVGPGAAASLAPCSVDAVVLLGQTSASSAVSDPDDVCSALLEAYGVDRAPHAMEAARERLSAAVGAARRWVVLERELFGDDGRACYPSVMLGEVLSCYGLGADASADDVAAALGDGFVASRSEVPVSENASDSGAPARPALRETPSPAGRIDASERACVSPPPEGVGPADARPLLSASQIETYLECPYKWFSLRRLRLRDADAGFGGAEMGTFAHRVLEVTHRDLLARAVERSLGGSRLAEMRAADPLAPQSEAYRAEVERLAAVAQADPSRRMPGSAAREPGQLEEARAVLSDEFAAHLAHQYQLERGRRPLPQALVAHTAREDGQVRALRDDLTSLLGYEAGALEGFEPRLFEWGFGRGGAEVEYAGVRLTGTVDRVDVDAHGQAVVIDYKHKSATGFAAEYDAFPKGGSPAGGLVLPRRVQSLVYGQVVRRAFPGLRVRAAVYLCTRSPHAIAGAVDENVADLVFGAHGLSSSRAERVCVPGGESFGRENARGMEALLDACEEAVAARLARMLEGDIEADPVDADACSYCPVLNCERRVAR